MSEYLTSELPDVELLKKLGYEHINSAENDHRESIHKVALKDRLDSSIRRLNPWMDDNGVNKCMHRLIKIFCISAKNP